MAINLKNLHQVMDKNINDLYNVAYNYGFDPIIIDTLKSQINLLYKYFGVRKLKVDVPPFKKDEIVQLYSDLSGDYLVSLDKNDKRCVDVFQAPIEAPSYEWFYK